MINKGPFMGSLNLLATISLVAVLQTGPLAGQEPDKLSGSPDAGGVLASPPNDLLDAASKARQQSSQSVKAHLYRKQELARDSLQDATGKQIRNQIETVNELNSVVNRAALERKNRLIRLENEMNDILSQIRELKNRKVTPPAVPRRAPGPGTGEEKQLPQKQSATSGPLESFPKSEAPKKKEEREFGSLYPNPVDKLALANNLVAIEKYDTAIKFLASLAKDKATDPDDLNWINYQLARCYRRTHSYAEAEKFLREAANSSNREIARTTSIWWLEQMESHKKMQESLDVMEQQLKKLGGQDDEPEQ